MNVGEHMEAALAELVRLMLDMPKGPGFNVVFRLWTEDTTAQPGISKVTFARQAGYTFKDRHKPHFR